MTEHPTVLITGATKGIGRALVERFAAVASELHLVARSERDLEALKQALVEESCRVHTYPADLSDPDSVKSLAESLLNSINQLDVLINNAGVYLPGSLLHEPANNLRYMMELNVLSHYELVRSLHGKMPRGSHLIHMASVASRKLFVGKPSYSISKHAQGVLTEALRHELRPLGIRVTSVMPGPTWSASWEGVEFPEDRLLDARHIANTVWQAWQLPPEAVMEEIVIRPFEGDIE
jgi:short-subunit dehydrogenase